MRATADLMAPDASPGELSRRSGVRRVNNVPLYLLGGVLAAFLVVMMLVAADRAARQAKPAGDTTEKAGSSSMFAREIAGDATGGMIPPAPPAIPSEIDPLPVAGPVSEPILIARPENLDAPPTPPARNALAQPARDEEAERLRLAKLQRLEEAARARTGVQVAAPRGAGSIASAAPGSAAGTPPSRDEMLARLAAVRREAEGARSDDPTAAYQARLAQLRRQLDAGGSDAAAGVGGGGGAPPLREASSGGRNSLAQLGKGGQGDRWALDARPEAPRTPFELRAGFVVPATLISGINAELPGQIMAQVAQHVYDTATGRHLLIPQGARLVGTYSSEVAYGQARVLVAWQRIVFPDGKALDLGAMPGADSAGYAGFNDQVNNHYVRTFASALLMSAVTAGITLSQDNDSRSDHSRSDSQRASDALSEALGQQLGQVTAQMIAKNLNIAPTLAIRPGYRFNVTVTQDLTFSKPYRPFDY
jgi:type IV secretion system protein VirB10